MTPEQRQNLAKQLRRNKLLPELFDAKAADIRQAWESEKEPADRERLWHELTALTNLRDFIYAGLERIAGDGGTA